jgi:hypothetical protein
MEEPTAVECSESVMAMLNQLTQTQLQQCMLRALRGWRQKNSQTREFTVHGSFGDWFVSELDRVTNTEWVRGGRRDCVFLEMQNKPELLPYRVCLWNLIKAGVIVPASFSQHAGPGGPIGFENLSLTDYGIGVLNSLDDHPFAPEFLRRLQRRCPDLPEEVFPQLEDAHACLQAGLLRPAVVLLGLAYEIVIERRLNSLAVIALTNTKEVQRADAKVRIDMLRKVLDRLALTEEQLRRARSAVDFAEHLRTRRNDGAHPKPTYPLDDRSEIEELIISAGRHLPALWGLTRPPSGDPASSVLR